MTYFNRMEIRGKSYFINRTVNFKPIKVFSPQSVERVFDFAYDMTFGCQGDHRDHRSGGGRRRHKGEIFANTFQGKLAECALYIELHTKANVSVPDFNTYGLGAWDTVDLLIDDYKLSIKSTKSFGNLLLLETYDWDNRGRYIPNNQAYDFTFLVRLNPYCEDIFRNHRILYSDSADYQTLKEFVRNINWEYDIPGFITSDELQFVINNNYIIPKNALLNGKMPMDAENYYVQAGDMHSLDEIIGFLR